MGVGEQYRDADPPSVQRAQEGSQQQLRVPVCAWHSPFPHVCINNLAKEGVLSSFADSLTSAGVRALLTLGPAILRPMMSFVSFRGPGTVSGSVTGLGQSSDFLQRANSEHMYLPKGRITRRDAKTMRYKHRFPTGRVLIDTIAYTALALKQLTGQRAQPTAVRIKTPRLPTGTAVCGHLQGAAHSWESPREVIMPVWTQGGPGSTSLQQASPGGQRVESGDTTGPVWEGLTWRNLLWGGPRPFPPALCASRQPPCETGAAVPHLTEDRGAQRGQVTCPTPPSPLAWNFNFEDPHWSAWTQGAPCALWVWRPRAARTLVCRTVPESVCGAWHTLSCPSFLSPWETGTDPVPLLQKGTRAHTRCCFSTEENMLGSKAVNGKVTPYENHPHCNRTGSSRSTNHREPSRLHLLPPGSPWGIPGAPSRGPGREAGTPPGGSGAATGPRRPLGLAGGPPPRPRPDPAPPPRPARRPR
ncbi:uncharacterized protein LOC132524943 [Lagenorhynchus albirostris]|uniref:uncharacterized protein LOC132524943 n=1 Tax=Lagenorhynchus albirostris TaxID=27610 RepID=UPI0028E9460E|nr:uncharacterized protein LOC132524943 [Lagenorhynchus albirostris]